MFKKNKKQTETLKEPKEKKVRTVKVGTHKKTVIALWVVLIASVSFGVYKNFTAIDQHTTHEKEIIELRLQDTNGIENFVKNKGIENFVKNFANSYYTWDNSKEAIEARSQAISGYLTKELQDLNVDTIRTDIPTSSTVTDVIVWHIEQSGTDTFSATYEVDQQIKEGEQTSNVTATYTVKVHVDADGDMVIVQNPTLAPAIEKSDYEPNTPEAYSSQDADTVKDSTPILETFIKINTHSKEAIEARTQAINGYLTKELQDLNVDTIRTDIPTSSTVTDVIVWSIEQLGTDTFSATYEVDQQIKEGEQTSNVKATYTVKVYVDADGDMVIVQNPTLAPAIEKSDYEPKTREADTSVDADTVNDATAFLETFFKLYPKATEKELAYYVSGNVLEPIGRDYLYSELVNPIFTRDGDNVKVKVAVKFLDNQTKATQVSQYDLVLHKDSNWKIVE